MNRFSPKAYRVFRRTTLKGKEAQTPSNKAFESGKTNTTSIPMLDITRPAHTVGITTEPSHWLPRSLLHLELVIFFLQLELELSVCSVSAERMRRRRRLRHVHVDTATNVLLDCFLHSHSYSDSMWICGGMRTTAQT